jgi:hypothetical protein
VYTPPANWASLTFGGGWTPDGMTLDGQGRLYVAGGDNTGAGFVRRYSADMTASVSLVSGFAAAAFLDVTAGGGHLYLAAANRPTVYRANLDGSGLTPFLNLGAGATADGVRFGAAGDGRLYVVDSASGRVLRFNPASGAAETPLLGDPTGSGLGSQVDFLGRTNGQGQTEYSAYLTRTLNGQAVVQRYTGYDSADPASTLTFAGQATVPGNLATGLRVENGQVYVNAYGADQVWRFDWDLTGGQPFVAAGAGGLSGPGSVFFSPVPEPAAALPLAVAAVAGAGVARRWRSRPGG